MVRTRIAKALAGLAFLSLTYSAHAVDERLQDVPLAVTTISAETISADEIAKLPSVRDIKDVAFLQPGESVTIRGRNSGVSMGTPLNSGGYVNGVRGGGPLPADLENIEVLRGPQGILYGRQRLPVKVGTSHDGTDITNFMIPLDAMPGPIMLEFSSVGGNPYNHQANIYAFLNAWLEQEKLRSGQRAQFGYDLSFGQGPGQITMIINTTGPIVYDKNGQRQQLRIDEKGLATLKGYISALRGSPTGIPFSIVPTFSELALRRR